MADIMFYGEQYDISAKSCLFMNLPNLQVTGEFQSSHSLFKTIPIWPREYVFYTVSPSFHSKNICVTVENNQSN